MNGEKYGTLIIGLKIMDTPDDVARTAVRRWKTLGRPSLRDFAPYFFYVIRVELFFAFLIATDVISGGRPKHRADFLYFYYLPFASIFTSNDKLQVQMAPLLMGNNQMFVRGEDLREYMNRLAEYYENLPQEVKESGSMTYAAFPPRDGDYLTSAIFDRLLPNWRRDAAIPKASITPEENARIMAHLKPMMDAVSASDRKASSD